MLLEVQAASATLIDFDHTAAGATLSAPGGFQSTNPLREEYAKLGVHFTGPTALNGGAILNVSSSFGVSAFSSPNFLAFNVGAQMQNGGVAAAPETITFDSGMNAVSFEVAGGSSPDSITLTAFDSSDAQVGTATVVTADWAFLNVGVTGANIRKVVLSTTGNGVFVADNLIFTVPEPGSLGLVWIGGVGLLVRRRRRGERAAG